MDWFLTFAEKFGLWAALSIALLWMLARAAKWVGKKLFDDDNGIVPRIVVKHNEFLDKTTSTNERMTVAMMQHTDQIRALERRLEGAWSARHSDPEVWDLLFVNNPVPMAMVARDGHYLNVNQAMCLLTGYTSVELKGMTWQQMTPEGDLSLDIASAEELAQGSADTYRLKKGIKKKDGTVASIELHAFRYPRIGAFRHFFSFYCPRNGG